MDLEPLSSKKSNQQTYSTYFAFLFNFLVLGWIIPFTTAEAQHPSPTQSLPKNAVPSAKIKNTWKFDNYISMQQFLLEIIKQSKHRIWLTSRFLSDSDFTLALYVARYRHIAIRVGLGEKLLHHPLSLYGELLDEKVPVQKLSLSPTSPSQSSIIVDNKAYSISTILHPLVKSETYEVKEVILPSIIDQIGKKSAKIDERKLAAKRWRKPAKLTQRKKPSTIPSGTREFDESSLKAETYDYTGKIHKKPENVNGMLPKTLKWQKQGK